MRVSWFTLILSLLSLQEVHNNSFKLSTLLIIDEDVVLADSKQKLKTAMSASNGALTFLLQNAMLAFKRGSH